MKENERQRKKEAAEQQKKAKQDAKEAAKLAKEGIALEKCAKTAKAKNSVPNGLNMRKRGGEEMELQRPRKRPYSGPSISRAATQRIQPIPDSDFTALQLQNDLSHTLNDLELGNRHVDRSGVLKSGRSRVGRTINLPTRFR